MTEFELIVLRRALTWNSRFTIVGVRRYVLSLILLIGLVAGARSEEPAKEKTPPAGGVFKTLDRNADGQISRDELAVDLPEAERAGFEQAVFKADVDASGTLSLPEFERLPLDAMFQLLDRDHNGELSFAEISPPVVTTDARSAVAASVNWERTRTRAAFEATDRDGNGGVSVGELKSGQYARSLIGRDPIGQVADPVLEQVDEALAIVFPAEQVWIAASDWANAKWDLLALDWTDVREARPDGDGDGQVSREEARNVFEVGLGIRRLDGTVIRLPTGRVFANVDFEDLDRDRDGRLTLAEYSARYQPTPEIAKERFTTLDGDKDGFATPAELISLMHVNLVTTFLHFDADNDGRVTSEEIVKKARPWEQYTIQEMFTGSDENQDGALSFRELGLTPLQNRVVDWNRRRRDANHDGALSYEEFRLNDGLFASVPTRRAFRLRDANGDGRLSYEELAFDLDATKVPPEFAFGLRDKDGDGNLTHSELFTATPPKEDDEKGLQQFLWQTTRSRLAFESADSDHNGLLSVQEFRTSAYRAALLGSDLTGAVPDPVLEAVETALAVILPDDQEFLPASEWPKTRWNVLGPDWDFLAKEEPDKDGDLKVSRKEAREVVETALGVRRTDGTPIRLASGRVFANVDFDGLDKNRDGRLTQEEYGAYYQPSPEVTRQRFTAADIDKDGLATPAELIGLMRVDLVTTLLHFDVDRNGRVTPDEIAKQARPWEQYTILGLFPGFDEDHDGGLSYRELGMTPLQNRVLNWNRRRVDLDHDAALSFEEFCGPDLGLFAGVIRRRFFRLRDTNHDGLLTLDELPFDVDVAKLPSEVTFRVRDKNANGELSFAECFTRVRPDKMDNQGIQSYRWRRLRSRIAFEATDADRNGEISHSEFRQTAYLGTLLDRDPPGIIPDPVFDEVEKALSFLLPDGRESLKASGWSSAKWDLLGPDWQDLSAARPDQDRDGQITRDEARRIFEIALGIRRDDDAVIRFPSGRAFAHIDFEAVDKNRDGRLTEGEFSSYYLFSGAGAKEKFASLDVSHDGVATPEELLPLMRVDLISTFLHFDVNDDGGVTADEIAHQARPWEQPTISRLFPGFDENGDGRLSYREFGLTPLHNRVLNWGLRRDLDHDSYLSYDEYRGPEKGLFACVMTRRFFRLQDVDKDLLLGLDEFRFPIDVSKIPIAAAFKIQDKNQNGQLSFAETFTEPEPPPRDKSAKERYEMRLAAAETRFLADDKDRDKSLSLAEFQQSREAALAAVERKTRALSRHRQKSGGDWFYPVVLTINTLVLLGGGWYLLRRS